MGTEFNEDEEQVVERKRWALFGLPLTFTKYIVKIDILTIEYTAAEGILPNSIYEASYHIN